MITNKTLNTNKNPEDILKKIDNNPSFISVMSDEELDLSLKSLGIDYEKIIYNLNSSLITCSSAEKIIDMDSKIDNALRVSTKEDLSILSEKEIDDHLHSLNVNVEKVLSNLNPLSASAAPAAALGRKEADPMTLNLTVPQTMHTDLTPRITVIGVGGGGTNAVDNMIAMNLQGVDFVVANTDAQQLMHSRADRRIQLGPHITQGLGAGAKPEVGRAAAEEAAEELYRHLDGAHMVFITAGMGGGTGTGAAPVIARMARERNILTVGVVTKPFTFEGSRRARSAEHGIAELQEFVDTLIVIPNQNLFRLATEHTGWKEAFKMADQVLYMGVKGVTDLMVAPGLVNLDFADIRTVMAEMGKAVMGTGEAEGEGRAIRAAELAISNPLLEDTCMRGAKGLLINITGGEDMTLFEVDAAANRIREEVDDEANIIFGSVIDETLAGKIRVSVVAAGIEAETKAARRPRLVAVGNGGMVEMGGDAVAMTSKGKVGVTTMGGSIAPIPLRPMAPGATVLANGGSPTGIGTHPAVRPVASPLTQQPLNSQGLASDTTHSAAAALPEPATTVVSHRTLAAGFNLFNRVTGLLRGNRVCAPASKLPPTQAQSSLTTELGRAESVPATEEKIDLEIPTFLRRQHVDAQH